MKMNNKSKIVFLSILSLVLVMVIEILYIKNQKSLSKNSINLKNDLVKIVGLPDLAISTEATYIRGRSLTSTFSIFRDDPSLLTYFPSTFIFSPNNRYKKEIK